MLSSLTPLVRPLAGSASASATTDSAAPSAPAGSATSAVADRGPSGGSTSPSMGAYVPPLARGSDAGAAPASGGAASAAYAEHAGDDTASGDDASGDAVASAGSARSEAGRWMSSSVTQPNAPSFSDATTKLQQGEAAIAADRRASLDYLVSSMKRMAAASAQPPETPEPTPAMRYATAAYIEF